MHLNTRYINSTRGTSASPEIFWALINSLVCWFCMSALGFVLFQIHDYNVGVETVKQCVYWKRLLFSDWMACLYKTMINTYSEWYFNGWTQSCKIYDLSTCSKYSYKIKLCITSITFTNRIWPPPSHRKLHWQMSFEQDSLWVCLQLYTVFLFCFDFVLKDYAYRMSTHSLRVVVLLLHYCSCLTDNVPIGWRMAVHCHCVAVLVLSIKRSLIWEWLCFHCVAVPVCEIQCPWIWTVLHMKMVVFSLCRCSCLWNTVPMDFTVLHMYIMVRRELGRKEKGNKWNASISSWFSHITTEVWTINNNIRSNWAHILLKRVRYD